MKHKYRFFGAKEIEALDSLDMSNSVNGLVALSICSWLLILNTITLPVHLTMNLAINVKRALNERKNSKLLTYKKD